MTNQLENKIKNIYALDEARTQFIGGNWSDVGVIIYAHAVYDDNFPETPQEIVATANSFHDAAFIAAAPEMVDIIRSLEAKVEAVNAVSVEDICYEISCGFDGKGFSLDTNLENALNEGAANVYHLIFDVNKTVNINDKQLSVEDINLKLQAKLTEQDKLLEDIEGALQYVAALTTNATIERVCTQKIAQYQSYKEGRE